MTNAFLLVVWKIFFPTNVFFSTVLKPVLAHIVWRADASVLVRQSLSITSGSSSSRNSASRYARHVQTRRTENRGKIIGKLFRLMATFTHFPFLFEFKLFRYYILRIHNVWTGVWRYATSSSQSCGIWANNAENLIPLCLRRNFPPNQKPLLPTCIWKLFNLMMIHLKKATSSI